MVFHCVFITKGVLTELTYVTVWFYCNVFGTATRVQLISQRMTNECHDFALRTQPVSFVSNSYHNYVTSLLPGVLTGVRFLSLLVTQSY